MATPPMKILALDTSTQACSAAIYDGQHYYEQFKILPRQHAKSILPMIESVLAASELKRNEIDLLAFCHGPGSFTGLRIAASAIQGLAFALDKPVVAISTLRGLAQTAYREHGVTKALTAIDARMAEIYWGAYQLDQAKRMQPLQADILIAPHNVKQPPGKQWCGIGDGWEDDCHRFDPSLKTLLQAVYPKCYPHARDIAFLAEDEFNQGHVLSASQAQPVYLRNQVVR